MAYQLKYDPEDEVCQHWVMVGNISPYRPPHLNEKNISSSEAGTSKNGSQLPNQKPASSVNMERHYRPEQVPSCYAGSSTADSVRTPNGPERKDPNDRFLSLGHAEGLGEQRHHLRAHWDRVEDQINRAPSRWGYDPPLDGPPFQPGLRELSCFPLRLDTQIMAPEPVQVAQAKRRDTASASRGNGYNGKSAYLQQSIADLRCVGDWAEEWEWGDEAMDFWPAEILGALIDGEDGH
jgi:hypothetical protein